VLLCLAILTIVASLFGRGFSYLFLWPTFAAAAALLLPDHSTVQQHLRFALVAAVTLLLLVPAVDVFLQLAHPRPGNPGSSIPAAIIIPVSLSLLAIRLLRAFWPMRDELAHEGVARSGI
jgi:hypothetical protein